MEKFEEKIEPKKEKEVEIQSPKFEIEDFEATQEYFATLTKKLTPALKNHEYNIFIGDDAAGRLPTLVIGGLFKEAYKEDKMLPPKIYFFSAGRHLYYDESIRRDIAEHIRKLVAKEKINPNRDRILLVTEYMQLGESMAKFVQTLKDNEIFCDVATLTCALSPEIYRDQEYSGPIVYHPEFRNLRIFTGQEFLRGIQGEDIPFQDSREHAGVESDHEKNIFAVVKKGNSREIATARRDVKKMIAYLKQIYDREKEKIENSGK